MPGNLKKNWLLIAYKLSVDLLFIGIVFFAVSLLAESLIPGIVTSRVGFSKISFLVVFPLLLSSALASRLGISLANEGANPAPSNSPSMHHNYSREDYNSYTHENNPGCGVNKKALAALVFLMIFTFFSSLFRLNILLNIFILAIAMACAYFIFKVVTEKE